MVRRSRVCNESKQKISGKGDRFPFNLLLFRYMERPRVELGTNRLKAECSTTELAFRFAGLTRPCLQ
jgi:hypothetical protein